MTPAFATIFSTPKQIWETSVVARTEGYALTPVCEIERHPVKAVGHFGYYNWFCCLTSNTKKCGWRHAVSNYIRRHRQNPKSPFFQIVAQCNHAHALALRVNVSRIWTNNLSQYNAFLMALDLSDLRAVHVAALAVEQLSKFTARRGGLDQ